MAFHAVNKPLRSAAKLSSTVLSRAGFPGVTASPGIVTPGVVDVPPSVVPVTVSRPGTPPVDSEPVAGGSLRDGLRQHEEAGFQVDLVVGHRRFEADLAQRDLESRVWPRGAASAR